MIPTLIQSSLLALSAASSAYASPLSTSPFHPPSVHSPLTIATLVDAHHPHGTVNNSYIVVLKDGMSPVHLGNHLNFLAAAHEADPLEESFSGLRHVYSTHLQGYSGRFTESVINQIRAMPEVDFVERDQIVKTNEVQKAAPWGLARISHRPTLKWGTFSKYEYDADGGEGVDVYVIDTGIHIGHEQFEGRASWGKTIPQPDVDEDGNGHGTHCAGTIASKKYGVAKKANVIAVKVLGSNGSGSMSDVVAGVEWAATSALKKKAAAEAEIKATGKSKHRGSVANMSLGGGKAEALDRIVNRAVEAGMHFAVAAGNENADACNSSPARAEQAVTVGASTLADARAYFSNHGSCVDVFGPGLNILSTWNVGNTTATLSGTSMASPHVAGLLAYLLSIYPSSTFNPIFRKDLPGHFANDDSQSGFSFYSLAHASLPHWVSQYLPSPQLVDAITAPIPDKLPTPAQLKKALLDLATPGILTDLPKNTVNLLIFNNYTVA